MQGRDTKRGDKEQRDGEEERRVEKEEYKEVEGEQAAADF